MNVATSRAPCHAMPCTHLLVGDGQVGLLVVQGHFEREMAVLDQPSLGVEQLDVQRDALVAPALVLVPVGLPDGRGVLGQHEPVLDHGHALALAR